VKIWLSFAVATPSGKKDDNIAVSANIVAVTAVFLPQSCVAKNLAMTATMFTETAIQLQKLKTV